MAGRASTFAIDRLEVTVAGDSREAGRLAAADVAGSLRSLTAVRESVRVVFAAAPSQSVMLAALVRAPGIDWMRVRAYQMDEYLGLPSDAPQRFGNWLRRNLFDHVPLTFHPLDTEGGYLDPAPVDLVCLGIGENGHLAFNDPPVARFDDEQDLRVVDLDLSSRMQQVHDGLFPAIGDVPTRALTLTIPRLMRSARIVGVACGPNKAVALQRTVAGPVDPSCPATALRLHENVTLYTDLAAYGG
ncbi:6-phosphogluconolactonase [Nakamurella sp. PAMC28650]|uniref:6-phosphogluconolactonase n=1 Tax=Nakamurella sp. PAMC28650 TaxID=2762325 RepID=UPI00164D1AD3|nr:6-phosphogluconolactonase [Nakamurella sp. PAMC28650]QNK81251.1 6-phosphogluconolactonase [Nakamurella sp. PAMC28650]